MVLAAETLRANIAKVHARIDAAAAQAGRGVDVIELVAVSKTHTVEECCLGVQAGLAVLGENRIQEARNKIPQVNEWLQAQNVSLASWHLVGHLQSNKAKYAVGLFDLIHSVDSLKLATEIDRRAQALEKVQRCLIEVNTSGEESKFGVAPQDATRLWEDAHQLGNLQLEGLMTIGPWGGNETQVRAAFAQLRQLGEELASSGFGNDKPFTLSMGMSGDLEWAVAEGSTMVRIGTAIFGSRLK